VHQAIAPVALAGLSDPLEPVRRNAAFCCGLLAEHVPEQAAPHAKQMLDGLLRIVQTVCAFDARRWRSARCAVLTGCAQRGSTVDGDNAVSSICRISGAMPHVADPVMVVTSLVDRLPLRVDADENNTVYAFLVRACSHAGVVRTLRHACAAAS
jgi:hypothetical protein